MADTTTEPSVDSATEIAKAVAEREAVMEAIEGNDDYEFGDDVTPTETTGPVSEEALEEAANTTATIDDAIYEEAEKLGLDREAVDALGEARALRTIVNARRKRDAEMVQDEPAETATNTTVEEVAEELGIDLTDDDVDPKILGQIKKMVAAHNKMASGLNKASGRFKDLDALAEQVKSISGFVQNAQQAQADGWLDQQIEALGPEWAEKFGTGPKSSLPAGSAHRKARESLLDDVSRMGRIALERGENPDPAALFRKMLAANHSDHQQKISRRKAEAPIRDRAGQFTTKPNGTSKPPSKAQAAEAELAEIEADPNYRFGG